MLVSICSYANSNWDATVPWAIASDALAAVEQSGCPLRVERLGRVDNVLGREVISIVRFERLPEFRAWVDAAHARAREKISKIVQLRDGSQVTVSHQKFDNGGVEKLFNGDSQFLMRSAEINPYEVSVAGASRALRSRLRLDTTSDSTSRLGSGRAIRRSICRRRNSRASRSGNGRCSSCLESAIPSAAIDEFGFVVRGTDVSSDGFVHLRNSWH